MFYQLLILLGTLLCYVSKVEIEKERCMHIDHLIEFWSTKPQPGTTLGNAWVRGAHQGAKWAKNNPNLNIESIILVWSARPIPGSPEGIEWVKGAYQGWDWQKNNLICD